MGRARYYLPNAVTVVGIAFAAIAVQCAVEGRYRTAAWWAMYCLLTDNIDGAIARRLRASSAFGAQLDSFADFFSFGATPVAGGLVYMIISLRYHLITRGTSSPLPPVFPVDES